jgi:hypothetical protein
VQAIRAIDPASPYPSATDHFDGSFYSYPVLLSRGWSSDPVTLYLYFYGANMANPLPGWTDIRIEAWRGTNLGGIAQGESAPKATAPASPEVFPAIPGATNPEAENEVLTGTLALGMRRDGPFWWILVTGVAPDGVRYRLANNREANLTAGRPGLSDRVQLATITPYGTAWDWLTAPG